MSCYNKFSNDKKEQERGQQVIVKLVVVRPSCKLFNKNACVSVKNVVAFFMSF